MLLDYRPSADHLIGSHVPDAALTNLRGYSPYADFRE
jgi:hypothetical protein